MLNIYDIIGYIATFLTVITGIPQLFKIIKTKKSNDISLHTFIILFIAQMLWIIYGFYKIDVQIIITNVLSGFITLYIIYISCYYNNTLHNNTLHNNTSDNNTENDTV